MFLWAICGLLILGTAASSNEGGFCSEADPTDSLVKPLCYNEACMTAITNHIEYELHAAFKYLYMGALFGQYMVERPGMAKFFLESAKEERGHAIQMMDYLNMRGIQYAKNYTFGSDMLWKLNGNHFDATALKTLTIAPALKEALNMELDVTKRINDVVRACADDFHGADVFTNPILEEQHTGVRKLQGAMKTLDELSRGHSGEGLNFADYIFDQKMLKGEL